SLCHRAGCRLWRGAADPRGVPPLADRRRDAADRDRERLRCLAGAPARSRLPHEPWRLGCADAQYRGPCRERCRAGNRQLMQAGVEAGCSPGPEAVFAALGDRTRLSMLTTLSDGEARSITSLAADTK